MHGGYECFEVIYNALNSLLVHTFTELCFFEKHNTILCEKIVPTYTGNHIMLNVHQDS